MASKQSTAKKKTSEKAVQKTPEAGNQPDNQNLSKNLKNDPLFLEMQEEMSRDNMIRFFKNNGNTLFTILVLLLLGIAGFKTWQHFDSEKKGQAGIQLFDAITTPESPETINNIKAAGEVSSYNELAKLNEAQYLLKQNKEDEAIKVYDQIASGNGQAQFRDLAALNAANILLNRDAKNQEIEGRLNKLTADTNTYKYSARELLAIYYIQNGANDKARPLLEKLSTDAETPITIQQRAKQILNTI